MKIEVVGHIVVYKFHQLHRMHALHVLAHAMQTRTLVAHHRIFASLRCLQQCFFELQGLAVGYFEHSLAFPYCAAAQIVHILGEYHFPSRFLQKCHYHIHQVGFLAACLAVTHGLVQAAREVYHLLVAGAHIDVAAIVCRRQRRGPQWHACLVQGIAHRAHHLIAKYALCHSGCREQRLECGKCGSEVVGYKFAHLITNAALWKGFGTQVVNHFAHVYLHRARGAAHSVAGAGFVAVIFKLFFKAAQSLGVFARGAQSRHLALHHYALARRQRKAATHAVHFAESTFYALVHMVVGQRKWFEALDVAFGVVVKYHSRIQYAVGVEQVFHFLHQAVSLLAPLVLHKWCHITTRAVLGLERPVVFIHHEAFYLKHQILIFLHLGLGIERLGYDEVIIAFEGMAIDARIVIAVLQKHLFEVLGGLGEVFDVECYILYYHRGAEFSGSTHRGEDA